MKLLLTSAGIKNDSIRTTLVNLLGKPLAESSVLYIPTAIYLFPASAAISWRLISGVAAWRWKSLGVLELTALPIIQEDCWVPLLQETDTLVVGGGDPLYLCHWMRQSGLADLLPSLLHKTVYIGVSTGSIATATTFDEAYLDPSKGSGEALTSEDIVFVTSEGEISRPLVTVQRL